MRTEVSLDIDDDIYGEASRLAQRKRMPLEKVIGRALREGLTLLRDGDVPRPTPNGRPWDGPSDPA